MLFRLSDLCDYEDCEESKLEHYDNNSGSLSLSEPSLGSLGSAFDSNIIDEHTNSIRPAFSKSFIYTED